MHFCSVSIILSIVLVFVHCIGASQIKFCKSRGNRLGECIPLRNCNSILDAFRQGRDNPVFVRRLQKLTCGFKKKEPMVCCPTRKGHKNFNLLPKLEECGSRKIEIGTRVIGGKKVPLGYFPWLARIGFPMCENPKEIDYYCGGTVINKRYILTAAHCTTSDELPVSIRLGEHDLRRNPDCNGIDGCSYIEDYKIEKIVNHWGYSERSKSHDISLIRVDREINFTRFIQPICLPFIMENGINRFPYLGQSQPIKRKYWSKISYGDVAGWGRTDALLNKGSDVLQSVQLPVVPNDQCNDIYQGKTTISDQQMCAGGIFKKDSCEGDSGGPLAISEDDTMKYFQVGIVSYGPSICGTDGLPGIYTRVTEYLDWILDNIES